MIEEIQIAKVATYGVAPQLLHGLRPVKFLFGTNGSGKTTISRIIADPTTYPTCAVVWRGGRVLETLVYIRDFVAHNFSQQLRGIFTLGEVAAEKLAEIETARAKVEEIERQISTLKGTLGDPTGTSGKHGELRALRENFEAECWKIKTAHDGNFQAAFSGVRNSRARFCDKILEETGANQATVHPVDDLKARANTVFAEGVGKLPTLSSINGADVLALEQSPVLAKKVVGKEDIDIAGLIRRLGNSDWVREGLNYADGAGSLCPFCQKALDAELLEKLNAFFDEAYLADIGEIARIEESYGTLSDVLLKGADAAFTSGSSHIDVEVMRSMVERLRSLVALNQRHIERKRKEPSLPITLEPLREAIKEIIELIEKANAAIAKHNSLVDNLAAERQALTSEIWKCLINEKKDIIDSYVSRKTGLDKAIAGLSSDLEAKAKELAAARGVLTELEKGVTSIQPTVTEINNTLSSFGFTSFKLATAGEKAQLYRIVRSDGSDAQETLSEGERSFITFLYFYHLIRGSTTASGINRDRIVVFDDPVSSLDSDVLFIVSSLIKRILIEAVEGNGRVKQIFMLTHNIYFHKEVSFDPKRQDTRRTHETFWVVRKVDGVTVLDSHETNPIRTSYELLWGEVKNPNRSKLTIQNVLRRILEHYFTILGNMDKDAVIAKFEGHDQQVCASLFSWINDGSHNFADDLYIAADDTTVARYLNVFKKIFEVTNHGAHYAMMIGGEAATEELDPDDSPEIVGSETLAELTPSSYGVTAE
ncbi:AAA family ATPase [Rhizobiaceae bacterium BDR2-2]|uniref:AAA family ATPase n=1 Tax=Ectorhizobium quercum TaxID=2965071 RepID=A0AAE3N1L4_9HYPH|nr:AAA family ATPase [Ectorhizobium quercum]MCX8999103.1 AAA family ATPase [Ectorhizobium quercum]